MLYSTKGKAEDAVKAMKFSRVSIYRPGLLITEREQPRMLEGVGQSLAKMLDRSSSNSIKVEDLARAMVNNATKNSPNDPCETIEHKNILKLLQPIEN